jgi:hypothetical protein
MDDGGWMQDLAAEKGGERWSSSKMRYTAHKKSKLENRCI